VDPFLFVEELVPMQKQKWFWMGMLGLVACTGLACSAWGEGSAAKPPKMTADVVYVPTPHDVVDKMLEMVKVTKNDLVYDLGSGDGRIVIQAAKKYGCKAIGFEIDDDRVAESLENIKKEKIGHLVQIKQQDIYTVDLSPASVITSYLLPEMNQKLIPQFQKMKPGSRIVCHDYAIPGAEYEQFHEMTSNEDGVKHYIYVYTVPLKLKKAEE
jgi:SAM-dependent methyltransferase